MKSIFEIRKNLHLDWYHDIVDGSPDNICVIDRDGVILHVSIEEIDDTDNSLIGSPIYDYFLPQFHENVREAIGRVFRTGKQDHYQLATGSNGIPELWFMTNLAPIFRDGEVVAVATYIRDITELKRVQHELNLMNEELEKRVLERTSVLNAYAHRLESSELLNTALRTANNQTEVFQIVVENALAAFSADFGGIYSPAADGLRLSSTLRNALQPPQLLNQDNESLIYGFFTHQTVRHFQVSHFPDDDCEFCSFVKAEDADSVLLVPLKTKDELVGVLYLAFRYAKSISSDEEHLIRVFMEASGNTLHRTSVMAQLEQTVSDREQVLKVLYDIMATASENESLDITLKSSLEKLLPLLPFDSAAIHLLNGEILEKQVEFRKTNRLDWAWMERYFLENRLFEKSLRQQKRYLVAHIPAKNLTWLVMPIRNKGNNLGALVLFGSYIDEDNLGHGSLISSFADEIGLVLENARQKKLSEELLILEERQRLARDLHDSVSQTLYGLVISADVSNQLLEKEEYPRLKETLKEIEDTALLSMRQMRLMLFELRPLFFETVGLSGALELRLNTVERRTGIETVVQIDGAERIPSPMDLEIYRIVTEALNNSLKHSKANRIEIRLQAGSTQVDLHILDDGVGFDASNAENGGIGISSMRERTNRLGGNFRIQSLKDKGTKILVKIPFSRKSTPEAA